MRPAIHLPADKRQELYTFLPIYFFLSITNLILKLRMTPGWMDGRLVNNHQALITFSYFNNEQDRLLQFLLPEIAHRLFSLSIPTSYALVRLVLIFLAFAVFHFYLRNWFSPVESFAGVLVLSGSLAVAFLIDDLQESAPALMLFFVLGLWAIRERKDIWFAIFLLLGGGLSNESMLVMPLGYFLDRLPSGKFNDLIKTGLRTVLLALPAFLVQGGLRYYNRNLPVLGEGFHLIDNLQRLWRDLRYQPTGLFQGTYFYPFLIFSIFWIYACLGFPRSPRFLRRVFWIVPVFVLANLITGVIREARQMLPLAFILIPMAWFFIFRKAAVTVKEEEDVTIVEPANQGVTG